MEYFLKIMSVVIAVLTVLVISLLVVVLLLWDINSKVILPEIIEYTESILTQQNIGAYLSVLTGIVTLLFPISLSIISDSKGKYFNSQEVTSIVFKHWTYKGLKWILGVLIFLTIISFFNIVNKFFLIIIFILMAGSLSFLFFFFKRLEQVIRDFSLLVRDQEKSKKINSYDMDKIKKFKISMERLSKVWQSKIDFGEEELIMEDMKWLSKTFDKFFENENINNFINVYGQYDKSELDEVFEDYHFIIDAQENQELRFKRDKFSRNDYNKAQNELITNNYLEYNSVDIILPILKNLTFLVEEKRLIRLSEITFLTSNKIFSKILLFESEDYPDRFNSEKFFKDFLYKNIDESFNSPEIKKRYPSFLFLTSSIYGFLLYEYYNELLSVNKAKISRGYLLDVWKNISSLQDSKLMKDYLISLSKKYLPMEYYEADIFDIQMSLAGKDDGEAFIESLKSLKIDREKILDKNELNLVLVDLDNILKNDFSIQTQTDILKYYIKVEKETAVKTYKYREIQLLIFEILALTLHHNSIEKFKEAYNILKYSGRSFNKSSFFPDDYFEFLTWIGLAQILNKEAYLRITSPIMGKYIGEVFNFIIIESFAQGFNLEELKSAIKKFGLIEKNSELKSIESFANKMKLCSSFKLQFDWNKKVKIKNIWLNIEKYIKDTIDQAEHEQLIPQKEIEKFVGSIFELYKSKSLLSRLFHKFDRDFSSKEIYLKSTVKISFRKSILRRYLIPNWDIPINNISGSLGYLIVEAELNQLEFSIFNKHFKKENIQLKRKEIQNILKRITYPCVILFRNAFPDYWVKNSNLPFSYNDDNSDSGTLSIHEFIYYKAYDSNPEILIIPLGDILIKYVFNFSSEHTTINNYPIPITIDDPSQELTKSTSSISMQEYKKNPVLKINCNFQYRVKIKKSNGIQWISLDPYGD